MSSDCAMNFLYSKSTTASPTPSPTPAPTSTTSTTSPTPSPTPTRTTTTPSPTPLYTTSFTTSTTTTNVGLELCIQTLENDRRIAIFVYKPETNTCDFYGWQWIWPYGGGAVVDTEKLVALRSNTPTKNST